MHKGSQGEWGFSHHYQVIQLPSGLTDAGTDLAIIGVLLPLRYLQGVTQWRTITSCLLGSAHHFPQQLRPAAAEGYLWNQGGILKGYSPELVDRCTCLPGGRCHRPAPTEEQHIATCQGLMVTLETNTVMAPFQYCTEVTVPLLNGNTPCYTSPVVTPPSTYP